MTQDVERHLAARRRSQARRVTRLGGGLSIIVAHQ
jgi:hypothetical protein